MKYKFTPFSQNIIFLDTEFSSLNPYKGEILSIGLVKPDGKELYLEIEYNGPVDPWVKKNILPTLKDKKVSRSVAIKKINQFVGKKKPYVVAYVNQFDIIYMHKLFRSNNIKDLPFYWLPIDFASILFAMNLDPYTIGHAKSFFKEIGIDTKKFKHTHNALDDARLLRELYLKMADKMSS